MRCYNAGRTNDEQLKIELLSQWKLEAEFRNSAKCIVETSAFEQIEIDRVNNGQRYLPVYVSLSLKTSAVGAEMGAFMASFQLDGLSGESSK